MKSWLLHVYARIWLLLKVRSLGSKLLSVRYLMMQLRSFRKQNFLCREHARYLKVCKSSELNFHILIFGCSALPILFSGCESGLLLQLLSLNWTVPELVVILGRYLDTLCPFLRHFPDAVAMVMTKLLELISSINIDRHVSLILSCSVKMKRKS